MRNPDHDSDDPASFLNAIEAVGLSLSLPPCPHCDSRTQPLPMTGTGWGVETFHEDACPDHEDNQPAHEVDFTGHHEDTP